MADVFTKQKRSWVMSRIKGKNTLPERVVFEALRKNGLRFRRHYAQLPGKPDAVLKEARLAIFIDGDFWHGYRYPQWSHKMKPGYWRQKIERNRARDRRTHAAIRRMGWRVIRLWEHQVTRNLDASVKRIIVASQEIR